MLYYPNPVQLFVSPISKDFESPSKPKSTLRIYECEAFFTHVGIGLQNRPC